MPNAAIGIGYALYVASEYIMGKTRFGSWLGLILEAPAKKLFGWIIGKPDAPAAVAPVLPIVPASAPEVPPPLPGAPSGPKPPA